MPEGIQPRAQLNKRLFGVLIEAIPIAELPADLTGTWQLVDLASGQDHAMFRVICRARTRKRTSPSRRKVWRGSALGSPRPGLIRASSPGHPSAIPNGRPIAA